MCRKSTLVGVGGCGVVPHTALKERKGADGGKRCLEVTRPASRPKVKFRLAHHTHAPKAHIHTHAQKISMRFFSKDGDTVSSECKGSKASGERVHGDMLLHTA